MIGSSGNINPNSYHTHKHEITKCLHETKSAKPEGGSGLSAGIKASATQLKQERESFSLRELLTDGLRSLFTKATGFWGRLGAEDGQGKAVVEDKDKEIRAIANDGSVHGAASAAKDTAANVLATAMMKPETEREEAIEEAERKVGSVESAVNGGIKKGQGGIQKFLQKFGEAAAKAGQFLKRKKKTEVFLSENDADFEVGNNSFLLDSYNRMGEYSTLAQDRSLEGKFRAKG